MQNHYSAKTSRAESELDSATLSSTVLTALLPVNTTASTAKQRTVVTRLAGAFLSIAKTGGVEVMDILNTVTTVAQPQHSDVGTLAIPTGRPMFHTIDNTMLSVSGAARRRCSAPTSSTGNQSRVGPSGRRRRLRHEASESLEGFYEGHYIGDADMAVAAGCRALGEPTAT